MAQIDGVVFAPRRIIQGAQGEVKHILKSTDPEYGEEVPFGEVYVSTVHVGVTKAWKLHTKSTSRLTVLDGSIKFVLCDKRESSSTFEQIDEIVMDASHYGLLVIPPNIAYGWQNLSEQTSVLLNVSSLPHDPEEAKQIEFGDILYDWK